MSPKTARWWGWGDARSLHLPEAGLAFLERELGRPEAPAPAPAIEQVSVPAARLPEGVASQLVTIVGEQHVRDDQRERVTHAAGKSYPDLVRLRSGEAPNAPDAVVYPGTAAEVRGILELCAAEGVAVVPFGGGTSVVGGVEPRPEPGTACITLDLERLDRLRSDRVSLIADCGAGLLGRRAEAMLRGRGLTLGHYPQSFERATIGGYVATRSAGQASTGYGRLDERVLGLRLESPSGTVVVKPMPRSATGPSLRELIVGSEGTLGVIVDVALRVQPAPRARRYEGWAFASFAEGVAALRELAQTGAAPDVARLSDREETRVSLALSARGASLAARAGRLYLRARGRADGCLAIVGFEGDANEVALRAARARRALRAGAAVPLGRRPGEAWLSSRYSGPYLRDELVDHGLMAETLETATRWSNLSELYEAVRGALAAALAARGTPALVACHVSHLYETGASLYFTFLARAERGAELEQWAAAKRAASEAIVSHGGTISHHHAVGRDHLPWMDAEHGELGLEVMRAVKERLDPAGIMNPGKLLPARYGVPEPPAPGV